MEASKEFIKPFPLNTAILFLVFNRLETTCKVFQSIREAKPPRLYIACDGARKSKNNEIENVNIVRKYLLDNIDWGCEVKTLFREHNLGCKYAVSSAITWFFKNEEMGIILEDDCLPSQSFFWFCEDLLLKYKDEFDIQVIAGESMVSDDMSIDGDFTFIKYPQIWGWASWARVWSQYDVEMSDWPKESNAFIKSISRHKNTQRCWKSIFSKVYKNKINTWDYQLVYALLKNKGKCIVPRINLITNIGFGEGATHTTNTDDSRANQERQEINFPLKYPDQPCLNKEVNAFYEIEEYSKKSFMSRIIYKLYKIAF